MQPGTPVVAAVDAGVPAIKDAIVNKFDWKAAAAGDGKSAKKTLHVHETAVETTGWTSQTHNKPSVSTPVEAAVAAPSQCLATPVDQQDATDQTTVLEATSSTAAPRSAVAAAKGFAPASQKADVAPDPVILPGDATPQGAQPASPLASTANQRTLGKTADTPDPSDADEGTLSSGNAFSIPALTQAVAAQPAAVFAPSLPIQFAPAGQHHVSADLATSPVSSAGGNSIDGASPQPVPVKRLEIALHDPFLGNVDVRAEMRGGALHAIVTGSQDGATPSMAALHQFLQQHDVTVHSLNYATVREGVTATASTTFSNSDMSRDTAGGSFSGGRDGGSHNAQGEGSQQQQRFGSSSAGYDESPVAPPYASQPLGIAAARPTLNTGSTLSIHI